MYPPLQHLLAFFPSLETNTVSVLFQSLMNGDGGGRTQNEGREKGGIGFHTSSVLQSDVPDLSWQKRGALQSLNEKAFKVTKRQLSLCVRMQMCSNPNTCQPPLIPRDLPGSPEAGKAGPSGWKGFRDGCSHLLGEGKQRPRKRHTDQVSAAQRTSLFSLVLCVTTNADEFSWPFFINFLGCHSVYTQFRPSSILSKLLERQWLVQYRKGAGCQQKGEDIWSTSRLLQRNVFVVWLEHGEKVGHEGKKEYGGQRGMWSQDLKRCFS